MSAEIKKEIALEIAHILFIDIVAYSKMATDDQRAAVAPRSNKTKVETILLRNPYFTLGLTTPKAARSEGHAKRRLPNPGVNDADLIRNIWRSTALFSLRKSGVR